MTKMSNEAKAVISPRGVERIRAGHLWIYRSDVRSADGEPGCVVRLLDERGRFQGRAFHSDKSQIALRLLTREDVPVDRAFFARRLEHAAAYRKVVVENTEAWRVVYGEADHLPSLIVDRYGDYLVLQTLSQGTERQKGVFVDILNEIFAPKGILERNDPRVRLLEGLDQRVSVLSGDVPDEIVARENGIAFACDLKKAQKTGSFLDQRENHWAARTYASGDVLDCFSYQGGFALTIADRCAHVEATDMAPAAVAAARRNQELNGIKNVSFREGNSFDILKEYDDADRRFDMVILDPPAFAKTRAALTSALRGYHEINLRAMRLLADGGILYTASCSYHLTKPLFLEMLERAAADSGRRMALRDFVGQPLDHPEVLTIPETGYIKGAVLEAMR